MTLSRFNGPTIKWFTSALKEYADLMDRGATHAELLAWSEGKWPEFRLKFGPWMNLRKQRDLNILEWHEKFRTRFSNFLRNRKNKMQLRKRKVSETDSDESKTDHNSAMDLEPPPSSATLCSQTQYVPSTRTNPAVKEIDEVEDIYAAPQATFHKKMEHFMESLVGDGKRSLGTAAFHMSYGFRKVDNTVEVGSIFVSSPEATMTFMEHIGEEAYKKRIENPWAKYCAKHLSVKKSEISDGASFGHLSDY